MIRNLDSGSPVFITRLFWRDFAADFDSRGWAYFDSDEGIDRALLLSTVRQLKPKGVLCTLKLCIYMYVCVAFVTMHTIQIFFVNSEKIDAEFLDACGAQLQVVSTMSVGVDHIDLLECKRRSIVVGHTPNVLTDSTADMALALTLAVCRRLAEGERAVRSGEWGAWRPEWMLGRDIRGSVVGVVGLGSIGANYAKKIAVFQPARILYWS